VPLRTPAELWREYWQPTYPKLAGATWPEAISYLAVSSAGQSGGFPYIPVSPTLWASQQAAALTALAFIMHARPQARLCEGQLCFLGSGTLLSPLAAEAMDTLEAVAIRRLPALLRPLAFSEDGLAAVLYASGSGSADRATLLDDIGSSTILLQELCVRPEGAIAIEDPRWRGLRLLPDHGVYFEFVPVDQVGTARPARYSASEVKAGVPYALAVSSPAGIWACLVGSVVRFERLNPPLLRLVETDVLWKQAQAFPAAVKMPKSPRAFPAGPPHPRTFGTGATHPGKPFRTSLSVLSDRG